MFWYFYHSVIEQEGTFSIQEIYKTDFMYNTFMCYEIDKEN